MMKLPGGVGTGRTTVQGEYSVGPRTYCLPRETTPMPASTKSDPANGCATAPLGSPLRLGDEKARMS